MSTKYEFDEELQVVIQELEPEDQEKLDRCIDQYFTFIQKTDRLVELADKIIIKIRERKEKEKQS